MLYIVTAKLHIFEQISPFFSKKNVAHRIGDRVHQILPLPELIIRQFFIRLYIYTYKIERTYLPRAIPFLYELFIYIYYVYIYK